MPSKLASEARLTAIAEQLLDALGVDRTSGALKDTPRRYARWWREFLAPASFAATAFDVVQIDQMVVVKDMRVWSLCEHHLLPFYCDITIGYLTNAKLLGLSKFARIAHQHARKLQVQERLVNDIADHIARVCETADIAVLASGSHLCMEMRGVRTPAKMQSSVMRGRFRSDASCRAEFFHLAR